MDEREQLRQQWREERRREQIGWDEYTTSRRWHFERMLDHAEYGGVFEDWLREQGYASLAQTPQSLVDRRKFQLTIDTQFIVREQLPISQQLQDDLLSLYDKLPFDERLKLIVLQACALSA